MRMPEGFALEADDTRLAERSSMKKARGELTSVLLGW